MKSLWVLVLVVAGLLFGAGTASAHSVVTGSDPVDGSSISQGPSKISITFNEVPQSEFAALTLVGPDGNLWSKNDASIVGQSVTTDVGELGPVGVYTMAYRVTSADGHPVSGTRKFTLTVAGNGTPGAKADANATSASSSGGVPLWPFLVAGGLVFGGGLAYALRKPSGPDAKVS